MTDTIHIRLCENEDVQTYNKTYANEIDRVEEICGNAVQETQDSIVLVLSDIDSERDNKGKEEHDKEGEEEEPGNDGKHEPQVQESIVLVDMNDTSTFNADRRRFVNIDLDECMLHKTNSNSLKGRESTHCFHIHDDDETKLMSLSVTVVYSGSFNDSTYSPGVFLLN